MSATQQVLLTVGAQATAAINGALAYRTTSQSAGVLGFPSESYDNGGWHDTSSNTSRLVVPSGVSLVRFGGSFHPSGTTIANLPMIKNGASFRGMGYPYRETDSVAAVYAYSSVLAVSSADYFQLDPVANIAADNYGNWGQIEALDAATKYALVYKSGTQALSAGTTTTITFDSEAADTNGFHDNVTNNSRLTVPSGVTRVRISANIQTSVFTGQSVMVFLKNGATFAGIPRQEGDAGTNQAKPMNAISAILEVTPGDYFEVQFFTTAASTIQSGNDTWFCIEEVPDYVRAMVGKSATQSTTAATPTIMAWGSEVYDASNLHDNTTNNSRITVPANVTYGRVGFCIHNQSVTGHLKVRTLLNGSPFVGMIYADVDTGGVDSASALTAWIPVTAGQYFEIEVTTQNNSVIDSLVSTWFAAEFR